MEKQTFAPIARACEIFDTQAGLAKAIGESPSFVNQMLYGKRPVPGGVARRIESETSKKGTAVSRIELCPDTWRDLWPELAIA